jgi:hypothetical protein
VIGSISGPWQRAGPRLEEPGAKGGGVARLGDTNPKLFHGRLLTVRWLTRGKAVSSPMERRCRAGQGELCRVGILSRDTFLATEVVSLLEWGVWLLFDRMTGSRGSTG